MKLKAGIFDDPQIRELSKNDTFVTAMTETEASAWNAYKSVVSNLLGKHKSADYECVVSELLHHFQELGARMSLKLHFLHAHPEYFPANCADYN